MHALVAVPLLAIAMAYATVVQRRNSRAAQPSHATAGSLSSESPPSSVYVTSGGVEVVEKREKYVRRVPPSSVYMTSSDVDFPDGGSVHFDCEEGEEHEVQIA